MVFAQVVNMVIIRNVLSLGNQEYLVSGKSNYVSVCGGLRMSCIWESSVSHLEGIKNVLLNTK
jgi:hypothetical protein